MEKISNERRRKGEGSLYFDKTRNHWRVSITLPNGKRKDFCSKCNIIAITKKDSFMDKYKESLKQAIKIGNGERIVFRNYFKINKIYLKKEDLKRTSYYQKNMLEQFKEKRKIYYQKNRDHCLKYNRDYKRRNKEKIKKYNDDYYQKNKETISIKKKEYYRKKLESQGKTYTKPIYSEEFKEKVLKSYINQEYGGVVITARKFGIAKATLQDWIKKTNSDVKKKQRVERLKKRKKWDRTYYLKHKEQIKEYKKEYYLRKKGEKK